MKKFEFISHTADIGVKVYGHDEEELFKNSAAALYESTGAVFSDKKTLKREKLELCDDTVENLLVRFLNELLYNMEVKKRGLEILSAEIKSKENGFFLYALMKTKILVTIKNEIKAATYHGIRIVKGNSGLEASIIFDV